MAIMKEFKEFVVKGSVVDMAVGVVMGAAFGKVVSSFLNDLLMPPLGLVSGGVSFNEQRLLLKAAGPGGKPVTLNYGLFVTTIVEFLLLSLAVFILVKGLNALKRQEAPTPASEKLCPECLMRIPIDAKRCGHCAQPVPAD